MKKTVKLYMAALLLLMLWGCGNAPEPESLPIQEATLPYIAETQQETLAVAEEAAALAEAPMPALPVVLEAQASGEQEQRNDLAVIDYSHTSDGYVMANFTAETEKRLKVLVKGPSTRYSYNLTPGQWSVFPLSDGNGEYQVGVYENISGTKYAAVLTVNFRVTLTDEFAPFLRPNQYVNYSEATQALALASELTAGLEHPLEKVAAVYDYVVSNFTYDYDRAATVQSGYIPVLDSVLAEKKGICFDYAALMTAMLRSQEVPCKMVLGYAGEVYHAWISVWTDENGWIDGVIFFDGHVWKRLDPTFASSAERSEEIMNFIENGSYTVKYLY